MNNKIKNWYGIWFLIMIVLFLLAFLLSRSLHIFFIAIIFSFILSYIGTRKAKGLNWYPVWSLISIISFLFVALWSLGIEISLEGKINSPFNLKLSFNLLFFFFLILSIYSSIKGIKMAKDLNGKGRMLSIILLILVSSLLLFSLYSNTLAKIR